MVSHRGLANLEHQPKCGHLPVADQNYLQVLEERPATEPDELNYGFTLWTIERLNIIFNFENYEF